MNALELLRGWPGWKKANAETVFSSPAWRLLTDFGGELAELRRAAEPSEIADLVSLAIKLDGSRRRLVIFDAETFPDLHRLRGKTAALPPEIVLALVEKECGTLLQTIENAIRRKLELSALAADAEVSAGAGGALTRFELKVGAQKIHFAIELEPTDIQTFGQFKHLDLKHDSILSLTREVVPEYAVFALDDAAADGIAPGCRMLIDENFSPEWRVDYGEDNLYHLIGDATQISFGEFVDDALPPVPPPLGLTLYHRGAAVAQGKMDVLGCARVFAINECNRGEV